MKYPGGKGAEGVYQRIINQMPPHDVYAEPFLGGGKILRTKRLARISFGVDPHRTALDAVAAEVAGKGGARVEIFDQEDLGTATQLAAAINNFGVPCPGKSIYLVHGCGLRFLRRFPWHKAGRTVIYCDPPYVKSTRVKPALYAHEMSDRDHRLMLGLMDGAAYENRASAKFLLSGYRCELYEQRLKSWRFIDYQAITRGGWKADETLWASFPEPVELHDYRFYGADRREREKYARRKRSLLGKLERMSRIERGLLLDAIEEKFPEVIITGR